MSTLKKLIAVLTAKQKKGILLFFMGSIFVAFVDTAVIALLSPFMTILVNPENFSNSGIARVMAMVFGAQSLGNYLIILCVLFIGIYLFRGALKIGYNFWQYRLIATYRSELSVRLFNYVMYKPYAYHLQHNTAETQRLVGADVANVFNMLNIILQTLSSSMVAIGIFAVLVTLNWALTAAVVIFVILFFFLFRKGFKKVIAKYAQLNFSSGAAVNKCVHQSIGGLKNILVSRRQDYQVKQFSKAAYNAATSNSNFYAVDGIPKIAIDTACMVMIFAAVLIKLLLKEDIMSELPLFGTFALAAMRLLPIANQMTSAINNVGYYTPSISAIYQIIQSGALASEGQKKVQELEDANPQVKSHPYLEQGVELENISFKYEDAEAPLYTDLSLSIPAKASVAFVGTTGSGKTTLADIILGLHKPSAGQITADGINITQNPRWWSSMLGYIPQFIYLCDDTIRNNVAFGIPAEEIDDDQVWDSLERAQMKEFVQSMPNGLDTVVGENGMRLSGGQRQRIGIARALYTKPQFLLMDEATSALDNETEKAIVESINALSGSITLLIIAHRITTIENCDIIYRIENGTATVERRKQRD